MNCNPQKFFVIVGNPYSGKTKTIQEIFRRKNFFPFKHPIRVPWEEHERFVVINGPDNSFRAATHLQKIKSVINNCITEQVSFVTPLSICFDDSSKDIKEILVYFNHLGIEMHYLVLCSNWNEKEEISETDLELFNQLTTSGQVHLFDRIVTNSRLRFEERNEELIRVMKQILSKERRRGNRLSVSL